MKATARSIDFRRQGWGHSLGVMKDARDELNQRVISGHGWSTPRPEVDDVLLVKTVTDHTLAFRVTKVEHTVDPHDMFFFTAVATDTPEGLT